MRWLVLVLALAACPRGGDAPSSAKDPAEPRLVPDDTGSALVLPPAPPVPAVPRGLPRLPSSPFLDTMTPDAIALGELLFYDARLSTTGKLACATCHDPARGYAGARDTPASGVGNALRTPALANLAWSRGFGWAADKRTLDDFLFAHVKDQLGAELYAAIAKIGELPLYRARFERVDRMREHAALHALAGFVLSRFAGDSPWDRMEETARVPKKAAAPDPIVAGYALFVGKAGCAHCHPPPLYTDLATHAVRGQVALSLAVSQIATPTLRGIATHAAFFHDAHATTLDAALAEYADPTAQYDYGVGSDFHAPRLSEADVRALGAFVRALTSTAPPPSKPALP